MIDIEFYYQDNVWMWSQLNILMLVWNWCWKRFLLQSNIMENIGVI